MQTLDFHPPLIEQDHTAPLLLFIHGGYWRALDKSEHVFFAEPYVNSGVAVANVNYDLCPNVTLDEMVEQVIAALVYCQKHSESWNVDPNRIFLSGHSAGAHLVVSVLSHPELEGLSLAHAIKGSALLTGIYNPEIATRVSVNAEIGLSDAMATQHNCFNKKLVCKAPIISAVGGDEPLGWIDQTKSYANFCGTQGVEATAHVIDSANHYTVLECAADLTNPLCQKILDLIEGNRD